MPPISDVPAAEQTTAAARRRQILAQQPLARMRYFASQLGWRDLRLESVRIPPEALSAADIPGGIVVYYCTTDEKFFLQINPNPHGQVRQHQATVCACRYGISNTGWRAFELFDDEERLQREVERLAPMLHRSLFKDRQWRYRLARRHPELRMLFSRRSRWPRRLRSLEA